MEPRFGHDFSQVRIHADGAAGHAAATLGAEAFTVGQHIGFARGHFLPAGAQGRRLLAHELAHTLQQDANFHSLALNPQKDAAPPASGFKDAFLGTSRSGKAILVKREVGDLQGYDEKLQAIAISRLAKADPAAVAQSKDDKWHAFETVLGIDVGTAGANDPAAKLIAAGVPFKDVDFLTSVNDIGGASQTVDDLKAHLARLDALQQEWNTDPAFRESVKGATPPFPQAIQDETDNTKKRLAKAEQTRAALVFGVSESDISFNISVSDRVADKVNLTGSPGTGSNSTARHGPVAHQDGDGSFSPDLVTAFDINTSEIEKPELAQGDLFHEVSHLADYRLAQRWAHRYQDETGRLFVGGVGLPKFKEWIDAQTKTKPPRLSPADAELIVDEAADASSTTEARANIHTFLAYFQNGFDKEATVTLTKYAAALLPGKAYATPPPGSPVLAQLTSELKTAQQQANKSQKALFEAAMASAKQANPSAWFTKIDFPK